MIRRIFAVVMLFMVLFVCLQRPAGAGDISMLENRMKALARYTIAKNKGFPLYVENDGEWLFYSSNNNWMAGFLPSILWRIYEHDPTVANMNLAMKITNHYLSYEEDSFPTDHNQWFRAEPYLLAFGHVGGQAYRKKIKEHLKQAKWLAQTSADVYAIPIDMMNEDVIIDSFMAVTPLLRLGNAYRAEFNHTKTLYDEFFKEDGSTIQSVHFKDGKPFLKHNHQSARGTTWARGTAWAMLGMVLRYENLRLETDLAQLRKTSDFWINHIKGQGDGIALNSIGGERWLFWGGSEGPKYKDTSGTAIASIALLKLAAFLGDEGAVYRETALKSYASLIDSIGENGGLQHGYYTSGRKIMDNELLVGDYYLIWLRNEVEAR